MGAIDGDVFRMRLGPGGPGFQTGGSTGNFIDGSENFLKKRTS